MESSRTTVRSGRPVRAPRCPGINRRWVCFRAARLLQRQWVARSAQRVAAVGGGSGAVADGAAGDGDGGRLALLRGGIGLGEDRLGELDRI